MADPVVTLSRLGGVGRRRDLRRTSRRQLRRSITSGAVVRISHGRYALTSVDAARVGAAALTGTVSHTSAALAHGWPVKSVPAQPHVTVPKHRKVNTERRAGAIVHWRDLRPDEITDGWVTTPVRTVIDCCLDLPFDEALAVFDSSWRAGLKPREVQVAALRLPRLQRDRVLAVARAADPRAANPLESVLHSIAASIPGLDAQPQVVIADQDFYARVDLADEQLRIVLEADSFEFHGSRKALAADCRRYDGLVDREWLVLRFSWEQVMFQPGWVAATIRAAVDLRRTRSRSTGQSPVFQEWTA